MVEKIGEKLSALKVWAFIFGIASVVLIKNGIHPIGPKWIEIVRAASETFPKAENYMSTSPMPLFLFNLAGPSNLLWWSFHFLLLVLWTLSLLLVLVKRFPNSSKVAISLFLLSPSFLVLILFIGHYDLFTVVGASIAVFATRAPLRILGVLVASMANPEQGLVTSLLMILLYLALSNKESLTIGLSYLFVSSFVFIVMRVLLNAEESIQRSKVISGELSGVLKTSFGVWSLLPLSLIGISGILLLLLANALLGKRKLVGILVVLYAVPYLFAFAILDKTRVGVVIAAAPYFMVCKKLLTELEDRPIEFNSLKNELVGIAVVLALLYPTIYFDIDAELRLPYKELLNAFLS